MVINYSFGDATLQRCDVVWPGAAESLPVIRQLHDQWAELTGALGEEDLTRNSRTRWPYTDGRPFGHVLGWVNIEPMKNVAEMGLARRSTPYFANRQFQ
jgi:hypothetical protein